MKILSLFSGIGAFERALENLNIPHEIVAYCEIDKYASKAYSILHNVDESLNLHDVTTVDCSKLPKDIDLVTYGFPCQDISTAGKQRGLEHEGETTRSGLVWEAHRIIDDIRPKIAICENVKNLVGKKFQKDFLTILQNLERMGYNSYWQVMNAKDYGVPQNRERVFIVSIRKDVDKGSFVFPEKQPLIICLRDILEQQVDKKFFLNEPQVKRIYEASFITAQRRIQEKKVCDTLCARDFKDPKCIKVPINSCIKLREVTSNQPDAYRVYESTNGLARCLKAEGGGLGAKTGLYITENKELIRKLTPPECFCLMGFDKQDALLLREKGISDTQLYKMAGNSIVVDVLMGIFKNLYNV